VIASDCRQRGRQVPTLTGFLLGGQQRREHHEIYLCGGSAKGARFAARARGESAHRSGSDGSFRKITVDEHKFDMAFIQQHAAEAAVAVGLALRRPGDKQ